MPNPEWPNRATFLPALMIGLDDDGEVVGVEIDFSDSLQYAEEHGVEDRAWMDDRQRQEFYTRALDSAIGKGLPTELAGAIEAALRRARVKERLEYLRGQIHAECISMGELHELQGLAEHIEPGDVELLEWAGVPEFEDDGSEA